MKKLAVLASGFLFIAPQLAQAEFYLGGKLGQSWLDDSCSLSSPCDDDSFGGGLYGGYNISDSFALEAGYDVLGDFESNFNHLGQNYVVDDKLTALSIAPKFSVPVGSVSLFGKLGAAWIDYDENNDVALLAALGAEVGLTDNLAARIEYQRINNITDDFISSLDVNSIFLGLTYTFGTNEPAPVPVVVAEPVVKKETKPEPVVVAEPAPEPAKPAPVKQKKIFQEYGVELFDHDSFKLAANSEQYFDWLVGVMKKFPQAQAEIIGHTDSRGSAAYNQSLSEKRAQSVANYLYSQGINESRISVKGEGENKPKASNDTAEGRMENRRVEVVIDEFEYQE